MIYIIIYTIILLWVFAGVWMFSQAMLPEKKHD